MPQHGVIRVRTWAEKKSAGPAELATDLCISFSDNGVGIPLESQPLIFDPFYTTKPVGVGTGIGLGIVQRIVEQYGGVIRFSSEPGNTEFVVRLPSDREPPRRYDRRKSSIKPSFMQDARLQNPSRERVRSSSRTPRSARAKLFPAHPKPESCPPLQAPSEPPDKRFTKSLLFV